ncbi:MAG: MATE family efflux transporter [Clostridia bacterium]|nr:MATE family efflux transporter [Clostridia bacterium]
MSVKSQNLTKGNLGRQILFFSVPLMISHILQVLFNMSDIAVVGRFSGAVALGAVGSTTTLVTLFTDFLIGVGNGVNVFVARYFGAGNKKDVEETVHSSALICIVSGLAIALMGVGCSRIFLTILHTKSDLLSGAVLYLKIYFCGMPALAIFNFGSGVLNAIGDTKRPLYYMTFAGVINVILNLFFVIVLKMSVAGVGLASVISQYISAFLIIKCLVKTSECYRLNFRKLRFYKGKTRQILSVSLPAGIQNAIFQLANLFVQGGVNSFPTIIVEGNSAASNADAFVYNVMGSFYVACSSFMSQNYGAGKEKRVIKSYCISLAYSFGSAAILGGLLAIFGRFFLSLFTAESAVVDAGMTRLQVMGLSYCVSAFMDCTIAASRGLGKSLVPTVIVFLGSCVFRVVWVYTVFAHFGTIFSLYMLYPFSWAITAAAEIIYFVLFYRKSVKQNRA